MATRHLIQQLISNFFVVCFSIGIIAFTLATNCYAKAPEVKEGLTMVTSIQFKNRWGNNYKWVDRNNEGVKGQVEKSEIIGLKNTPVSSETWEKVEMWQKDLLNIRPVPCEKWYPVEHKDSFNNMKTKGGIEIEVLFKHSNRRGNVLIIPGNSVPASALRPLATELHNDGINVFSMNYYNSSRGNSPKAEDDLANLIDASKEIKSRYNIKNILYVGHSRGGHVIQRFFEQSTTKEKAVLVSPNFGEICEDQVFLGPFKKRFDADDIRGNEEKWKCYHMNSAMWGEDYQLFDIDYKKYQELDHFIKVVTPKSDQLLYNQDECFSKIKSTYKLENFTQEHVEGDHLHFIWDTNTYAPIIKESLK